MTYNGWSNRETWLVNVWYNPETVDDVDGIQEMLEYEYDQIPNGVLKDMINLNDINWNELKSALDDDEDEDEGEDE